MKFTEEQRNKLRRSIESDFGCVCLDSTIDHIEQIISERDETIHPVPSIPIVGGGSVASDRTEPGESGQSAEDVESIFYKLCDIARRDGASIEYLTKPNAIEAMRLHASQVCADKEQEIDRINESLTVMVNRNAELEKELEYAKIR